MPYKNREMDAMLASLGKHLRRTDKIGYAAARNTRILRNESAEYFSLRDSLIEKHGEPELDADGNPTGRMILSSASPNYRDYLEEISEWAEIEHDPQIYRIGIDEAIDKLTGEEMLELEWMLEGW